MGEHSLLDVVHGALEMKIPWVSAYAFSTENWKRSPEEVRFLMGFNRDVVHRRLDELDALGVRVRWAGQRRRLWRSVIKELEIADAAARIAKLAAAGRLNPDRIDERTIARYLDEPEMPDVDLFVRSSGEQRTSNFLLWQAAYAEMVFLDRLWPDFDRRDLWQAIELYVDRDRRYGGAEGPAV